MQRDFIQLLKIVPASENAQVLTVAAGKALETQLVFLDKNGHVMNRIPLDIYDAAVDICGVKTNLFNNTFFGKFPTKKSAFEWLSEQMFHYITTYAAEKGGSVPSYVPNKHLGDERLPQSGRFTVIQVLPKEECLTRFVRLLSVSQTFHRTQISNIRNIMLNYPELKELLTRPKAIASLEVAIIAMDIYGIIPQRPVDQLRYMVYKTTGETLLIKNNDLIYQITRSIYDLSEFLETVNLKGLASIFYRYKPLFLAFRNNPKHRKYINKIRRLAPKYHKPMSDISVANYLNLNAKEREEIRESCSIYELVKLHNAVMSNLDSKSPRVYNIRNGRTWVDSNQSEREPTSILAALNEADTILNAISHRLSPALKGRKFYLPENIMYAAPVSNKQSMGGIPYGTVLEVPSGAFTTGIHWFNQDGERVDIDLHLRGITKNFGWNTSYGDGSNIVYTGDLVDAPLPHGAAEAFWMEPDEDYIITTSLYSGPTNVKFKMYVSVEEPASYDRDYVFDPNSVFFQPINLELSSQLREHTIGLYDNAKRVIYLYGGSLSNGNIPRANYPDFITGLKNRLSSSLYLYTVLLVSGARLVDSPVEEDVIDLSPDNLKPDTLWNLMQGILPE